MIINKNSDMSVRLVPNSVT